MASRSNRKYCSRRCNKNAWQEKHREKVNERIREYYYRTGGAAQTRYKKTPQGKEAARRYKRGPSGKAAQLRARAKPGYSERRSEINKRYYDNKGREYAKRYQASERGRIIKQVVANNRRKAVTDGERITASQWNDILNAHNHTCAYCLEPFTRDNPATIDHVRPLSKGGRHRVQNIVPACKHCNCKKHTSLWRPVRRPDMPMPEIRQGFLFDAEATPTHKDHTG